MQARSEGMASIGRWILHRHLQILAFLLEYRYQFGYYRFTSTYARVMEAPHGTNAQSANYWIVHLWLLVNDDCLPI